jgi:ectoine hydroxylase-related dioxygenase (phytanoyl-CoA dioxygenase family)
MFNSTPTSAHGITRVDRDDIEAQCRAIEEVGACVIEGALQPEQVGVLATRLQEQASAELSRDATRNTRKDRDSKVEQAQWIASSDDPTQWVGMLPNKGRCFIDLAVNPPVLNLAHRLIGKACIVSEFSARITKPGSPAMDLHSDQWWLPQPVTAHERQNPIADIERKQVGINNPKPACGTIAPRVVMTTLYALADVTAEMGPTRFVPGSHLCGGVPGESMEFATIAPELVKGDAIVFDGRLWHGSNPNQSDQDRLTALILYTGPQFRQLTNYTFGLRPDLESKLSDTERDVFGYRVWNSYGATDDYSAIYATPGGCNTGELPGADLTPKK